MKDANWQLNIDTEKAKADMHGAILTGVTEVFELDIKPEAVRLSPFKTGNNRRLIDVDVVETPQGVQARLFSQRGYGGYLELGTRFMKALPYLYPAFNMFIGRLTDVIGTKVKSIRASMFEE